MDNAIEALETACAVIILALALQVFMGLHNGSEKGEDSIMQGISHEWLIVRGEDNE